MGYTTDFDGIFVVTPKLNSKMRAYLTKFSETRHMKRNADSIYGVEGEFFIDGNDEDKEILDDNEPAKTQPGLWCQWIPTEDGTGIEWDGGEKFYEYVPWIKYLIEKILAPNGYVLNGVVKWQGEEMDDRGKITIKNNKVIVKELE